MIPIDDPHDPRIAAYRAVRERDLVGRSGRFIAEGEVVLRVLAQRSRHEIESVLLARPRLDGLASLVESLPPSLPVYVASRTVMDVVVGFPIHRGVLAVGRRAADGSVESLLTSLPPRALVLGLVGLANHDNVGGIFRNAAAFGVDAVVLDSITCDPLYRKAIRVSVGGTLIVPFARAASPDDLLRAFGETGFETLALAPHGSEPLCDVRAGPRTALLLGAEGSGLPPHLLARARTVRIPMAGGFDSLNVATASGIALYQVLGCRSPA